MSNVYIDGNGNVVLLNNSAITPETAGVNQCDVTASIDGNFQDISINDIGYTPVTPTVTASATATNGVTYTHILGKLTFAEINRYAKAISNASDIDNITTDVYITDGGNHFVLSIGDTICYTLSTDELIIAQILGFNHDDLTSATAYGEATTTGKAGITFQMENCLVTRYIMNDTNTNAGGWNGSKMRTTTLPAIKSTMPSGLQSVIKMVDKKSANGGGTNYTATVTSSDDLFLFSEIEIYATSSSQDGSNEGVRYKYWDINNSGKYWAKYYDNNGVMTARTYWLRSCVTNTTSFKRVNSTTGAPGLGETMNGAANGENGVSFGYCI